MAETIEAYGLCQAQATPLAQGTMRVIGYGLCESEGIPLAEGILIHSGEGLCEAVATPLGFLSKVILWTATAINSNKIRIEFDRGMLNDDRLVDYLNYTITPTGGGIPLYYTELEPENRAEPTFVDIITSEMTDGEGYRVEIEASEDGPVDTEGIFVDPASNTESFTGIGTKPTIASVVAISENRADVIFSEPMEDNRGLRDASNYSFDKGLSVISVLEVDVDTVKLVTSDQIEGELYTLTITH